MKFFISLSSDDMKNAKEKICRSLKSGNGGRILKDVYTVLNFLSERFDLPLRGINKNSSNKAILSTLFSRTYTSKLQDSEAMQLLLEELHDDGVTLIFKDEIPLKKKKRDATEFEIASQVENDEITTTSTITLTSSAQSETQANEEALEDFLRCNKISQTLKIIQ